MTSSTIDISESVATLIKLVFKQENASWPKEIEGFEQDFFDFVSEHGVIPILLYLQNNSDCCRDWPESLLTKLTGVAKLESLFDKLRKEELSQVLDKMVVSGVHPILLKGTPLSYSLYPGLGLRPRCDTDLLIERADMEKVADLMGQLGYKSLYEGTAEFINSQITFVKQDKLNVSHAYDVHWQISNNSRPFSEELSYDYLSKNAREIPELGVNAKTLNSVDALLLACFHRAGHFSHMGDRLIWLYDIHLLVETLSEQDVKVFYQKAKKLEIVAICSDAISAAKEWFGTSFNEALALELTSIPEGEASEAYLKKGRSEGIKNHALMELKALSSWRERFKFLFQKVFPPVNYMMWRYEIKRQYYLPYYYFYRVLYGAYIFLKR